MSSIESLKEEARRHEQREEWQKALTSYQRAINRLEELEQPDIGLYNRIGDLRTRVGELEGAAEAYKRAVDLYVEAELPNNAIAVCKKMVRNMPLRNEVYLRMGQIRARQGFLVDARQNFLTYAERVQAAGDIDEAFRALIEFADVAPEDLEIRRSVANLLLQNDREEEALEQLAVGWRLAGEADRAEERDGFEEAIADISPSADPAVLAEEVRIRHEAAAREAAEDTRDEGVPGAEEPLVVLGNQQEAAPGGWEPPAEEDAEPDEWSAEPATAGSLDEVEDEPTEDEEPLPTFGYGAAEETIEDADALTTGAESFEGSDDDFLPATPEELEGVEHRTPEGVPGATAGGEPESGDETVWEPSDVEEGDELEEADVEPLPTFGWSEEDEEEVPAEPVEPAAAVDEPAEAVEEAVEEAAFEARAEERAAIEEAAPAGAPEVERDPGELLSTGRELAREGDVEGAAGALDAAQRGYDEAGDLEGAIEATRELVELRPDDIEHRQRMVELAFRMDDRQELAAAYLGLAQSMESHGQDSKARALYQQVLSVDPSNEVASAALAGGEVGTATREEDVQEVAASEDYVDLGGLILEDEESEKTTRFKVAYEEPSGDEEADFARMLDQFKQKVSENLEADDVTAHHDLGTAYKEMGLLDEAIQEFQAALRASPYHLPTYELLGQAFMEKGEYEAAVRSMARALDAPYDVEDELISIYYHLGRAHEELGNTDSATEFYDRVFSLDINFADVTERLRKLR